MGVTLARGFAVRSAPLLIAVQLLLGGRVLAASEPSDPYVVARTEVGVLLRALEAAGPGHPPKVLIGVPEPGVGSSAPMSAALVGQLRAGARQAVATSPYCVEVAREQEDRLLTEIFNSMDVVYDGRLSSRAGRLVPPTHLLVTSGTHQQDRWDLEWSLLVIETGERIGFRTWTGAIVSRRAYAESYSGATHPAELSIELAGLRLSPEQAAWGVSGRVGPLLGGRVALGGRFFFPAGATFVGVRGVASGLRVAPSGVPQVVWDEDIDELRARGIEPVHAEHEFLGEVSFGYTDAFRAGLLGIDVEVALLGGAGAVTGATARRLGDQAYFKPGYVAVGGTLAFTFKLRVWRDERAVLGIGLRGGAWGRLVPSKYARADQEELWGQDWRRQLDDGSSQSSPGHEGIPDMEIPRVTLDLRLGHGLTLRLGASLLLVRPGTLAACTLPDDESGCFSRLAGSRREYEAALRPIVTPLIGLNGRIARLGRGASRSGASR